MGAQSGLVALDGEHVVGSVIDHQFAGGLPLGMQCVEADEFAVQIEFTEQFARGGDLVGFVFNDRAAQVVLPW